MSSWMPSPASLSQTTPPSPPSPPPPSCLLPTVCDWSCVLRSAGRWGQMQVPEGCHQDHLFAPGPSALTGPLLGAHVQSELPPGGCGRGSASPGSIYGGLRWRRTLLSLSSSRPFGLLHSLPVPRWPRSHISLDFVIWTAPLLKSILYFSPLLTIGLFSSTPQFSSGPYRGDAVTCR